jgi:hypothetical protein
MTENEPRIGWCAVESIFEDVACSDQNEFDIPTHLVSAIFPLEER